MYRMRTFLVLVLLAIGSVVLGQDIESGPEKDKPAPGLKVFDATGATRARKLITPNNARAGQRCTLSFERIAGTDRWLAF